MAEIQKVTEPVKIVTDPVLLAPGETGHRQRQCSTLARLCPPVTGQEYSPYARIFRDLKSGKRFMVISGLPMVDAYGQSHELGWTGQEGDIHRERQ